MQIKRLLLALSTVFIALPAYVITESFSPLLMAIPVGVLIGTSSDDDEEIPEDVRREVQEIMQGIVNTYDVENPDPTPNTYAPT